MKCIPRHKLDYIKMVNNINLTSAGWPAYELLDSGRQKKLERFGPYRLIRFEPEAKWKPALEDSEWLAADASFSLEHGKNEGQWKKSSQMPRAWQIKLDVFTINLFLKNSRHIGIFPEQLPNWEWIKQSTRRQKRKISILNLFAYTGLSTVYAVSGGAAVTHVDASKSSIIIAKKNLGDSGMVNQPVRWIIDDAIKFVNREVRRGSRYDAIIMDPPKFGRGPGGEIWRFENDIGELLGSCASLLSKNPAFFIITAYSTDAKPSWLGELLKERLRYFEGEVQCGYLFQEEKSAGRKIIQSLYARWENFSYGG